jgi:hypothetical protein
LWTIPHQLLDFLEREHALINFMMTDCLHIPALAVAVHTQIREGWLSTLVKFSFECFANEGALEVVIRHFTI